MIPLALLNDGEKGEIVVISSKGKGLNSHLRNAGLFVGTIVEVLSNHGHGPVLLKFDEARMAVGRVMAMKIFVKRLS